MELLAPDTLFRGLSRAGVLAGSAARLAGQLLIASPNERAWLEEHITFESPCKRAFICYFDRPRYKFVKCIFTMMLVNFEYVCFNLDRFTYQHR